MPRRQVKPAKEHQFDAQWLGVREPIDHRSRDETIVSRLSNHWSGRQQVRWVDLGCGTGSNARYLAPRLHKQERAQTWVFVDHDESLLARLETPAGVRHEHRVHADLDQFVSGMTADAGKAECVTASALLDLVPETWVRSLVEACERRASAALFALTYNGEVEWWSRSDGVDQRSGDEDDRFVRDAVNTHQHSDKGLGAALGPAAGAVAETLFQEAGYHTVLVPTPWRVTAEDTAVLGPLVDGWVAAATECVPSSADRIREWAIRRKADVSAGRVELTVGHVDLLALPDETQ